jgi:hypothetical protein
LFSFTEDDNSNTTIIEKVYLHFDRHFYLSGDDIWFKAYLINAQTNKLSQQCSRILYAELISPESKLLMRRVLYVDSAGCSVGDFKLKETAISGKYRIRAYTRWMLNFGDVYVFEKEIDVQNISVAPELSTKKKSKDKNDNPNGIVITREDIEIQFFPESGSLVSGIENIVAFKANDWSGKGADVKGGILNSNGDTLTLFASEYLGMGKFAFTPQFGELYSAFFVPKDVTYPLFAKFPEPLDKGFTLNITDNDTVLVFNVRTTFNDFLDKKMLLVFKQSEKPLFGYNIIMKNNSKTVYFPKSLLPAGITNITLYDEQTKPHCERLVYIENKEKFNISITPVDDTVSTIKVTDSKGEPLQANLSMSITNTNIPDEIFNIESYFWLESEIKGKIERPTAYFNPANADRFKQIDLLLLTQGWRDFVWKHIDLTSAKHEMEKGLKISGHVEKLIGQKPYSNANISMSFPHLGVRDGTRFTQTDTSGNYNFGYMNFSGYKMMLLSSRTGKNKKAGEIYLNPLYMPAEDFPVKIWQQYQTDSMYIFPVEHYKRKNYKLTDTLVLDPVTIVNKDDRGYLMSDKEITPKDDLLWVSLDYYIKGQAPSLITAKTETNTLNTLKITYYDSNGEKLKTKVPHPSKISMKDVDRVRIYKKNEFVSASEVPNDVSAIDFTKFIYSVDVYSKHDGFTSQNYATTMFKQETTESSRNTTVNSDDGYYEEIMSINFDYYDTMMPKMDEEDSEGLHKTIVGDIDYSSRYTFVGGFYEERKFYTPKFHSSDDIKDYFGTYYWQADISTDTNGESLVNYNPEKQPSGKIRIEGMTKDGIPLQKELKMPQK